MNGVADASKDEEEVNPALTASARLSAVSVCHITFHVVS